METKAKNSWPSDLPKNLTYLHGEQPLHAYVKEHARRSPDRTVYHYYGSEITWRQLDEWTNRLAQFLQNKGIQKGDRVAIYMQNCPQYMIGYFGIQKLGAIVVPLNPMYKEAELEYFLNEVEVKAVIASQELYERIVHVQERTPTVQFILTTNYRDFLSETVTLPIPEELQLPKELCSGSIDLLDVLESTPPLQETAEIDVWEDVCLMSFTSGTTGRPKAAMLTFGNALFKGAAASQAFRFTNHDTTIIIPPLCHIGGKVLGINIPIYSGCECVIMTRFDAEATVQAIEHYQINKLYTLAPMNAAILDLPNIEQRNLSSLDINFATSFGIPVTEQLADRWLKVTKGCIMLEATYGLSETHDIDTFMPPGRVTYGSCGIPTYETEMAIVDMITGERLPAGQKGEIVIKSPGVFKGYYKRPADTAETLRDGWLYTGDIGMVDDDGFLYLYGRVKEMIKSSGYSVFPEDVEALLSLHEAVFQVAVIGVPDDKRGESIKAFIVLKPAYVGKVTEKDLMAWAKDNMAAYKYPRQLEFRDHLPSSISGKVLRKLLS